MVYTIPKEDILAQLLMQLKSHFFITEEEQIVIENRFENALAACEENFKFFKNKYFHAKENGVDSCIFNPYHSVQYMIFLYYLSHDIYKNDDESHICEKIYYLNKIFHSVDMFYAIELPTHFSCDHPLGSVLGRAQYGDGFDFIQGCTVGGTKDKYGNISYPIIGVNCHMFCNSSIIGKCNIGNYVNIGAGCIVKNQDVPDNCTVFGESPNLIIKPNK